MHNALSKCRNGILFLCKILLSEKNTLKSLQRKWKAHFLLFFSFSQFPKGQREDTCVHLSGFDLQVDKIGFWWGLFFLLRYKIPLGVFMEVKRVKKTVSICVAEGGIKYWTISPWTEIVPTGTIRSWFVSGWRLLFACVLLANFWRRCFIQCRIAESLDL